MNAPTLRPDGSSAEVRAYAATLRAQAIEQRADAAHLDEIAGALERWATREECQGSGSS